ncbi:hypothetical protein ACIQ6U_17560 [Lysinibacillus fusiformis]|uniref:hypothetical protein n=1 Tax=Lysinibacillus fusiformis TaxID=28031 RepID=UPI00382C5490
MQNLINPFVKFVKQYDISMSDYTKIFDEYTETVQYEVESEINKTIINLMRSEPTSIIITGNAGDGKTRICRNVYENLTGVQLEKWDPKGIEEIKINGKTIRIIKDFSELQDNVISQELVRLQNAIANQNECYLIAANEGKLTHALVKNPELKELYDIVTSQLSDRTALKPQNLHIYNLLHTSSSIYALKILQEWNKEENWKTCGSCKQQRKCIIYHNHNKLKEKNVQVLINRIYRSLDASQTHMTMRELLIQLAYVQIGSLSCEDIHQAKGEALQEQACKVYYENLFGHSASADFFEKIPGFMEIKKYDPGLLSNSKVDDFIFNGDLSGDDSAEEHGRLFGVNIDTEYGYFKQELHQYRSLYKTDENLGLALANNWLPRLRRKYYFESKSSLPIAISNEKSMIAFKFRQDFLQILKNEMVDPVIQKSLIRGLNQYFAKQIVYSPTNALYVVNENLFIYRIIEFSSFRWNVEKKDRDLDYAASSICLEVDGIQLKINLLLFEYLMRLANGGLPHILSDDVEILINNFKNKLIRSNDNKDNILEILKYNQTQDAYVLRQITVNGQGSNEVDLEPEFD